MFLKVADINRARFFNNVRYCNSYLVYLREPIQRGQSRVFHSPSDRRPASHKRASCFCSTMATFLVKLVNVIR
jgi:hypothetical protein